MTKKKQMDGSRKPRKYIVNPEWQMPSVVRLEEMIDQMVDIARKRHEAKQNGRPLGPITGLPAVDNLLGGWLEPGLHFLHASPGMGKTALGLQIACNCGCPSLYASYEQSRCELNYRIAARITSNPLGKLKNGTLDAEEHRRIFTKVAQEAPKIHLQDDCSSHSYYMNDEQPTIIESAKFHRPEDGHFLVIVDSLHRLAEYRHIPVSSEYERLNLVIHELKNVASELDCPVLCIAERNRHSSLKGGLAAGAGTRKIEYSAETVLELGADFTKSDHSFHSNLITYFSFI